MASMIKFVVDQASPAPLEGLDMKPLFVRDLDGNLLFSMTPTQPWTIERLDFITSQNLVEDALEEGADAFLGDEWIGSTEV